MKFIRIPPYLLLLSILISVFIIFISMKRTLKLHTLYDSQYNDLNILAHPENYPLYDISKGKNELNGTDAYFENSTWIQFLPELYIHSAFADKAKQNSNETSIHIMAIGPKVDIYKQKLLCIFQNNETQWKTALDDYVIIRHLSFRYFLFNCISRNDIVPAKIGLKDENTQNKSPFLNIHYKDRKPLFKYELTVCVLPVFKDLTNMELLAEFLGYYDAVGVNSFVFYDFNMTKDEIRYLNMVSQAGINITIIPWKIPNVTKISKQRILQIASVQHCTFQNQEKTKYILPIKIDEFLIPKQHFSLIELMNELSTIPTLKVGSFVFRLSNFCTTESTFKKYQDGNLITSRYNIRETKIWTDKKKSRYIARPETIVEGGLNYVRKHIKDWISANVPWQLALIHHYTTCSKKQTASKLTEDRTADLFKYEILFSKPMTVLRKFKTNKTQ